MSSKRTFILVSDSARANAAQYAYMAPHGWKVTFSEPGRSLTQNAKFHAIMTDLAKSGLQWAGKARTEDEWKVLIVSAHATATKAEDELVIGLEGELVSLRESTANMSKARGSSLIEYALAFCALYGVPVRYSHPAV